MSRLVSVLVLTALVAVPSGVVAMHDPDITDAEFKCQLATGKAAPKYLRTTLKCATKCYHGLFSAGGLYPASDCYWPYGGVTADCAAIGGTAGLKFRGSVEKACDPTVNSSADCPECYDAAVGNAGCGEGGFASDEESLLEEYVKVFPPIVLCKTTFVTNPEKKCQENAAKAE